MIEQDFLKNKKGINNNPNKNIVTIVILIIVLLVGGFFVYKNQTSVKVKTFSDEISTSGKNIEIPEKFPKDLPIVESSLVEAYIRNPETKDIDTIFESKKTAKENFDYYLNYFKKNSWQIDEAREINENKPGKILTSKDGFVITLVFEEKENNGSKITISSTTINTKQLENIDIIGLRLK